MSNKTIKLYFTDFYFGFDIENNFFTRLLSPYYNVLIDNKNPDYLIYSCYGKDFLNYNCIRIFYTPENIRPDFNLCDYAIGFDNIDFNNRNKRFISTFGNVNHENLLREKDRFNQNAIEQKQYFCNFIYTNKHGDPVRDIFFHKLSSGYHKTILSPGKHLNNCDFTNHDGTTNWRTIKHQFQNKTKFTIAFENSTTPGYTSEKIIDAFLSNTIPIYWGNPEIEKDFNSKAFINCHHFKSFDEVIKRIIEIDTHDDLYLKYINAPVFSNNLLPDFLNENSLLVFFRSIFDQDLTFARQRPVYGTTPMYEREYANAFLKETPLLTKIIKKTISFIK